MSNWSSGFAKFMETHPDADSKTIMAELAKCERRFDYKKFVEHYNNLSVEEWKEVVKDMADKGYDIRSVLCYKARDGKDFDVDNLDEIINPLLEADGSAEFVHVLDGPASIVGKDKNDMRIYIEDLYKEFGLPIPRYWRKVLWNATSRDVFPGDELDQKLNDFSSTDVVVYGEPEHVLTKEERYERVRKSYEKKGIPLPERYRRLLCN